MTWREKTLPLLGLELRPLGRAARSQSLYRLRVHSIPNVFIYIISFWNMTFCSVKDFINVSEVCTDSILSVYLPDYVTLQPDDNNFVHEYLNIFKGHRMQRTVFDNVLTLSPSHGYVGSASVCTRISTDPTHFDTGGSTYLQNIGNTAHIHALRRPMI
jgi:hypothetical protein